MANLNVRSFDIPQIHRFGVGFERMLDRVDEILRTNQTTTNYPPYNIIRENENVYSIEVAVAGFNEGEITINVEKSQLIIEGKKTNTSNVNYVHQGIGNRDFSRIFTLADHVEVVSAHQENGILSIKLERQIPDDKKPKTIAISYHN